VAKLTLEEQLKQINDAITAIEIGGQEYQIGSRRLRRADLSLLYKRQKELEAQINFENNPNHGIANTFVAEFDRR
jgi:hypothetical protein